MQANRLAPARAYILHRNAAMVVPLDSKSKDLTLSVMTLSVNSALTLEIVYLR